VRTSVRIELLGEQLDCVALVERDTLLSLDDCSAYAIKLKIKASKG